MFAIDGKDITATRGDAVFFYVTAEDGGEACVFQKGDLLRIKIFEKKACENVVVQRDFPVVEEKEAVEIFLSGEDTAIGEIVSQPTDYWYEVELHRNGNVHTIIGYSEDGPAVFRLLPEGGPY